MINSFFGRTELCKALFSSMKQIKSKYRSRLTDCHVIDFLLVASSPHDPHFSTLVEEKECQVQCDVQLTD
jgi:hypothetical protein